MWQRLPTDLQRAVYEYLDANAAWEIVAHLGTHAALQSLPKYGFARRRNESWLALEDAHILPSVLDSSVALFPEHYPWMCSQPPCAWLYLTSEDAAPPIASVCSLRITVLYAHLPLSCEWSHVRHLWIHTQIGTTIAAQQPEYTLSLRWLPHLTHLSVDSGIRLRTVDWHAAHRLTHLRWDTWLLPPAAEHLPNLIWLSLVQHAHPAWGIFLESDRFIRAVAPQLQVLHLHNFILWDHEFPRVVEFGCPDSTTLFRNYRDHMPALARVVCYVDCLMPLPVTDLPLTVVVREPRDLARAEAVYPSHPIRLAEWLE
jgi:hypothetical protein